MGPASDHRVGQCARAGYWKLCRRRPKATEGKIIAAARAILLRVRRAVRAFTTRADAAALCCSARGDFDFRVALCHVSQFCRRAARVYGRAVWLGWRNLCTLVARHALLDFS